MWTLLARVGPLLSVANGSSFKSLAEAFAANAKADTAARQFEAAAQRRK